MLDNLPPQLVPFAKIDEADLIRLIPLFKAKAIKYKAEELNDSDSSKKKVNLLYIEEKSKNEAQKIVDSYFSTKKRSKSNASVSYIDPDKKFVLMAVLFILWILFKTFLKSGI